MFDHVRDKITDAKTFFLGVARRRRRRRKLKEIEKKMVARDVEEAFWLRKERREREVWYEGIEEEEAG